MGSVAGAHRRVGLKGARGHRRLRHPLNGNVSVLLLFRISMAKLASADLMWVFNAAGQLGKRTCGCFYSVSFREVIVK